MTRYILLFISLIAFDSIATPARVAIIIDDIGYRKTDQAVLNLPGKVTYAVLPHTPYGKRIAKIAHERNLDVMLHIPMESENSEKKLGPGALTSQMNEGAIRAELKDAFKEIPFAIGINNHMGSRLTKMYSPMAWTMRYLKENNLIFIDSVTTRNSKARKVASHFGVPSLSRNVFLDNQLTHEYISGQFDELITKAKSHNNIIAIAHPHPETIAALTNLIPELDKNNIKLVSISELLDNKAKRNNQNRVSE
jgi:uncharacterized protein